MLILLTACARTTSVEVDLDLLDAATAPIQTVEDVPWEVTLYDERPSAYLPAFLDVEFFGAAMFADAVLRSEGDAGFLTVRVEGLLVDVDGPLVLVFTVSSSEGRTWRADTSSEPPTQPASCTASVDATTSGSALADELLVCLRDWTDSNGGPNELFVEVAATTADDDWSFAATWTFGADRPVEAQCSPPQSFDEELRAQVDQVSLENLTLAGLVAAADAGVQVVAFENTRDGVDDAAAAGAFVAVEVEAGEGAFVGAEVPTTQVPTSIVFRNGAEPATTFPTDWAAASIATLDSDAGFVEACSVRIHDALPNEVWVDVAIVGDAVVDR